MKTKTTSLSPSTSNSFSIFPLLTLTILLSTILFPAAASAQQIGTDNSLGTVTPNYSTEKSVIAVASFGTDNSVGLEFETIPRVIRRDLEISGFFLPPSDQDRVRRINIKETKENKVYFDVWQEMGVDYYLMGNTSRKSADEIQVRIIFYDIESEQLLINRYVTGPSSNPRIVAHRIADEIVKTTQFVDGIAETKLLFLSEMVRGVREVALVDADGFNQRNITQFQNLCATPTWGANGTEVYYTSYIGNRAKIYGQMLSSGQTWEIASYGGTNHSPAWNQTRKELLVVLSKDGNSEIYATQRNGQNLRRLTRSKAVDGSPTWSPDGSKYAYVSNELGGAKIFVANADGSNKRQLVAKGGWNDAPSWSPDGERVAFVSEINGKNEIFVINANADPSTIQRLTQNQGNNESPSWAPNSRHIAFSSDRSGSWQIYIMLDDGSSQVQITTSGNNRQPDWSPAAGK